MAISKEKKNAISEKLASVLAGAASVVFVRFHKLSVADTAAVRKQLKQEGVGYYVAKKTLIKRALAQKGFAGELPPLEGEIALAWSEEDPTAPARLIWAAGKKYKDALAIAGGVFEEAFADAAKMLSIATIPPLPALRGMFANVINSPRSRLAIALAEVAKTKTS
ncbi:MAG TPA: 50S ribosomal protein L10 [Candidatus Paceibacterota bacterium]|nr:50S ribosomal protein L10 [Candidatus Paceibacterota bacterium]